jgi:hypothetical protein
MQRVQQVSAENIWTRGMVVIPLQNYKNYKEMIPILDLYFSGKRMVADQPLKSWKIKVLLPVIIGIFGMPYK